LNAYDNNNNYYW